MPKLVKRKNQWCIQESFPEYAEPKLITHYWPIGRANRLVHFESYEGSEVSKFVGCSYAYHLRLAPYDYADLYLIDLGKTVAIDTEIVDIPCPKVKKGTGTRWNSGRWQKYLKTKGWVMA